MKKVIIFSAIILISLSSVALCGEVNDNNSAIILLMYKEQQMKYMDMILEVEKDNARLEEEHMELLGKVGSRNSRYIDERMRENDNRRSDNRNRIKDLEFRKSELKIKVMEKHGSIPEWWTQNEYDLDGRRAKIQTEALRAGMKKLKEGVER